ncbi:hypothetical protein SAMN05192574_104135 [Mucilaginibacter gossypiicola]|uniref:Uncharacterized protein n=1 Tax=Mucilaginibacter gossypiicola TaxID=551995 RepID=A0A1H8JCB1_9SPHI|nr:hypothetical protein [Mucilaginibacter gossypiicola]SEN78440.1 hypothetical protein SAMN05192574_104135 [Mucilaginibacter gossypiicola]
MGNIKEAHDFWQTISKIKVVKWALIFLLILVVIFFSIAVIKSFTGKKVKIFGRELYSEETLEKRDTVIKMKTPQKYDTLKMAIKNSSSQQTNKKTKHLTSINPANSSQSSGQINQNSGINSGSIGGKNNLNAAPGSQFNAPVHVGDTYNEIKIKEEDLKNMLNFMRNKVDQESAQKKFNIHTLNNSDAANNAIQIIEYLEANGFKSIERSSDIGRYGNGIFIEYKAPVFEITVGHYVAQN